MNKVQKRKFRAKPNAKTQAAKKLRTILFSRLLVVLLLLLIQLAIFIVLTIKLEAVATYFFGGGVIVSAIFLLYLVNVPGKNEFKLAWILPVLIMPVFGITLYFMYKYNQGGIWLKRKLRRMKEISEEYIPEKEKVLEISKNFTAVEDICSYLYKFGRYPCYKDTATEYFSCGEDFFADLIDELKKAKHFVFIEFFIVEPCQIMDRLLEILSKKAEEGVEVRILFDSIGSISLSSSILKNYFTSYGISSKVWLKFIPVFNTGLNNRDHRKIICIDGKVAYTGGINITDEYANIVSRRFNYWKDAGIKITGPAARTFTLMFLQQWNVQNKKKVPCENFEKFISKDAVLCDLRKRSVAANVRGAKAVNTSGSKPGLVIPYGDDAYNGADLAENVFKYILEKSTAKVRIMTPYIIIDNSLLDDLIFAANRGVQIEIIVPKHYDHFVSFCVGRTYIKNLIENGIKVFAYETGFIHSKVFVADSKIGTIGSINLDYRSLYHHFECSTFLYKTDSIKAAEKDFDNLKNECSEITTENYRNIPWFIRTVGWIFRIFAPLM